MFAQSTWLSMFYNVLIIGRLELYSSVHIIILSYNSVKHEIKQTHYICFHFHHFLFIFPLICGSLGDSGPKIFSGGSRFLNDVKKLVLLKWACSKPMYLLYFSFWVGGLVSTIPCVFCLQFFCSNSHGDISFLCLDSYIVSQQLFLNGSLALFQLFCSQTWIAFLVKFLFDMWDFKNKENGGLGLLQSLTFL